MAHTVGSAPVRTRTCAAERQRYATMALMREFVFGYGSLVAGRGSGLSATSHDGGFVCSLPGFARGWGVAMDNRRTLPGYKYYTTPDGTRPAVFVSFLDVRRTEAASTNGRCRPVGREELDALDRRERNYARLDVSDRIDTDGGRVWTYVGRPEARARLLRERRAGTAVIAADYLRTVQAAFAALGPPELAACQGSLAPGELTVLELIRNEIAPE